MNLVVNSKFKIIPIKTGFANSFLIKNGNNSILIDTGIKGKIDSFLKEFKKQNIDVKDIKLIVLTHTHYDHTGSLPELEAYSRARILVHKNEFDNLKNGFTPIPNGTRILTKMIVTLGKILVPKYASPPLFHAHLINNSEYNLIRYGIEGKVISTPGHTTGSQSVLLGNKLIAGDTFFNIRNKPGFPPFANHPKELIKTWEKVIDLGVEEIYPAHGSKFCIEKIIPILKKQKRKYYKL